MKTILLLLLGLGLSNLAFTPNATAQIYSPRRLTRRLPNQPGNPPAAPTNQPPAPAQNQAQPPVPTPVAPVPAVRRPVVVPVPVARPVDPEKEKAAQEKADQKAVQFEMQRADDDFGW